MNESIFANHHDGPVVPREPKPRTTLTLDQAHAMARIFHAQQRDKAGEPYYKHVRAVAESVALLGGNEEEQIAALFHDAVEDGHTTLEALRTRGCTEYTLSLIDAVTKRRGQSMAKYIAGIKATGLGAVRVKLADLQHNTRHDRVKALIGVQDRDVIEQRLKRYRDQLTDLWEHYVMEMVAEVRNS